MDSNQPWPDATFSARHILILSSLFDMAFSIDWIQELSKAKATVILKVLERACQEKLLEKKESGIFYFDDPGIKEEVNNPYPKGIGA